MCACWQGSHKCQSVDHINSASGMVQSETQALSEVLIRRPVSSPLAEQAWVQQKTAAVPKSAMNVGCKAVVQRLFHKHATCLEQQHKSRAAQLTPIKYCSHMSKCACQAITCGSSTCSESAVLLLVCAVVLCMSAHLAMADALFDLAHAA